MITDHVVRLSFRIHVGSHHREVDLAVPASSTLNEVMDDVMAFSQAPRVDRPWRAATVSGTLLDLTCPLAATGLRHGSIVVLSPRVEESTPVVRDAAELLLDSAPESPPWRLLPWLPLLGAGAAAALLVVWPLDGVPLWARLLLLTLGLLTLHRRCPGTIAIPLAALACAAGVGATAVLTPDSLHAPQLAWGIAAAVAALLTCVGTLHAIARLSWRWLAGIGSLGLAGVLGTVSIAAGMGVCALAAEAILLGMTLLLCTPRLAMSLAGLTVPRLPSAGQTLAISDDVDPHREDSARRAGELHDGFLLAATLILAPGLLLVALSAAGAGRGVTALVLCLATAGAVILHAMRYHRPWGRALLSGIAILALLATMLATVQEGATEWGVGFCLILALGMTSAPAWWHIITALQPTTMVWYERAEFLALALIAPLSLHLMGLFAAIRGLG
ncbi:type VII secretion integral membrane protein EccD [Corynebacterium uropygiale]|uniref:Type VII secretion integral membrane protein EccD n=1 Tax=Corynebacterium uropygiale TaxID=1775911 RepID=A0A9X1U6R0_9CORY|nr:type VII secretion integral membrane protein EccD [Corynebacterium uropygiale]MCF4005947.1 type VII secretion integral membrane protein EccD [Corynebacterium uropygiale]